MTKKKTGSADTNSALQTLAELGTLTLSGANGLVIAREAIEHVMTQAGITITFDPSSEPDLVDYLTIPAVSGLEGALLGAGLGTLLGLLVGRPGVGFGLGAGIGLIAGASRGVQRVQAGWRIQAVREQDGAPCITINAVETG